MREGMVVGLIAPGSAPTEEKLARALSSLKELGFNVRQSPNLRARHGFLAGTDEQRLADLHWAFSDCEIEAVWCVRGGYGCARLLPQVDFDLIRRNPKPFIGYSDITALHLAIGKKTGLPAEEITAAHGEARQRMETARGFGLPAVDAIRYVLEGDRVTSDLLAVAAAKLTLPMSHRTAAMTAVSLVSTVVLSKKHVVDRKVRDAVLGLSWIAALRIDPSFVRRAELAMLHDHVAADLGDADAGKPVRQLVERFLEDELRTVRPLVPPPMP